jgi:hypothetical protein
MRKVSWLIGAFAYTMPVAWVYFEIARVYGRAEKEGDYLCGLPMLAIIVIGCIGAAVLSSSAFALGIAAFRNLQRPRSLGRLLELAMLALPALVSLLFVGVLLGPTF